MADESWGFEDEYGFIALRPMTSGQRKIAPVGHPTGPAVGERLPNFQLTDHTGRFVDLHEDRRSSKAAVVFFRSVVW